MRVSEVSLRDIEESDLPIFYSHQTDRDANYIAAFTAKDPLDKEAFLGHWKKIMASDTVIIRTILKENTVVGHIAKFEMFGEPEITYWLGKEYWGQGITTLALTMFLEVVTIRPLFARAAKDNIASLRVLRKCGFNMISEDKGFANARGTEIEEYVLKLNSL
ncbi:GNAT family N-acetyltransferase [Ornithinibacillus californiensis]|uniref:GNAT family N-acetyltransferase n=1 Tax=Ornithinibacillus californiensis TaxID=161536 RepID=UPI00064E08F5|nr:GNAT family N-acetyltransferase [Ornithinibacillus californiensis]